MYIYLLNYFLACFLIAPFFPSLLVYLIFILALLGPPTKWGREGRGDHSPLFLSKYYFYIRYFYQHSIGYHGTSFNIILIIDDYSNIGNLYQNLGPRTVATTGARAFFLPQIFQPCYGTIYKRLCFENRSTFYSFLTRLPNMSNIC